MSRRARHGAQISLFPFLAVLICIMGALVVLLVLMVARVGPEAQAVAAEALAPGAAVATLERDKKLQEQLEDAQWRRELLEQQRTEKAQELSEGRDKLAHLENHIRELQDQAKTLLERAKEIDEGRQLRDQDLAVARLEVAQLQSQIATRKTELEQKRKEQAAKEQSYALIPYDGPNGTRRRPIYIECTAAGIVLQPEGIVFGPEDFNGPMDPGNPLDAALRTLREYLARAQGGGAGSPYPLLVVRPSGVVAYSAARSALKSWDDEFGYELISEEKRLEFGQPDRALVEQLDRAVATARARQKALALAMPRRFQGDEPLASFSPDDLPSAMGGGSGGGSGGLAGGHGGAGGAGGLPARGGTGGFALSGRPVGAGMGGTGRAASSMAAGTPAEDAGPMLGLPTGETGPIGVGGSGGGTGTSGRYPSTGSAGPYQASRGGTDGGNAVGGNAVGGAPGSGSSAGGRAVAGQSSAAGGYIPPGASRLPGSEVITSVLGSPANGDPNAPPGAAGASATGQRTSGGPSGQAGSGGASAGSGTRRAGGVIAGQARAKNWGLPGGGGEHITAITRPIHIAVLADRFVVVPDVGDDRPPIHQHISPQLTQPEVDALVTSVQKEMKSWGLAVDGGYWKPILDVEVAPDAEQHFADLQTALQNSGFEIQRKVR
jgi:hypothetical protein